MSDFQHYFAEMPWVAIPHGDKRKDALSQRFGVEVCNGMCQEMCNGGV
jgi:hypothetical protein